MVFCTIFGKEKNSFFKVLYINKNPTYLFFNKVCIKFVQYTFEL